MAAHADRAAPLCSIKIVFLCVYLSVSLMEGLMRDTCIKGVAAIEVRG